MVAAREYRREAYAREREVREARLRGEEPPPDHRAATQAVLRDLDGLTHLSKSRVDMLKRNLQLVTDALERVAVSMPEKITPLSKRQSELLEEIAQVAEVDQGAAADDDAIESGSAVLRIV